MGRAGHAAGAPSDRHVAGSGLARQVAAAGILVVFAATLASTPAAAHGEPFFQLGAERVRPGGTVEVRADLGGGDAFDITLVSKGDGSRRSLGTVAAVEEGHLQSFLTIPADVQAGEYLVEIAYDLTVLRAALTIAGPPVEIGGGEQPGQDDGLLQPFPGASGAPAGAVGSAPPAAAPVGSVGTVRAGRQPVDGLLIVAIAIMVAAGVLVAIRLVGRRERPRAVDTRDGA